MIKGLTRSWPVSFLVRHVLESSTEYAGAVEALQASPLMAPTYIIVAGVHPEDLEILLLCYLSSHSLRGRHLCS